MAVDESLPLDPAATPPADDGGSLADFEAQFGSTRQESRTESTTPPAESPEPEPEPSTSEGEGRDEKGRFLPKKGKHHSAKHEAGTGDVPRIQELSAKVRALELERDALKARTGSATPEVSTTRPASPPLPPQPAPPKPKPVFQEYLDRLGDYTLALEQWTDDLTDWKETVAEQKRAETERQRQLEAETAQLRRSWNARITAAMQKYPDFEDVALKRDTAIPPGSLIDAWVLEHKTGADVLYHLQSHPDELHALLAQPVIEQAETLALLSQRFNGSSSRTAAAGTGSAPALPVTPAPRPPNPVRTSPQHASDEPPGDDASLADHERYYPVRHARA